MGPSPRDFGGPTEAHGGHQGRARLASPPQEGHHIAEAVKAKKCPSHVPWVDSSGGPFFPSFMPWEPHNHHGEGKEEPPFFRAGCTDLSSNLASAT